VNRGVLERQPAVAGAFYPAEAAALARAVDALVEQAPKPSPSEPLAVALVMPHAGYVYSGRTAAAAAVQLAACQRQIRTVAVLGPAHFMPVEGIVLSPADRWRTPLGTVPVDAELRALAGALPDVVVDGEPFLPEHSVEVEVPFLQRVLGSQWRLLPALVGSLAASRVADFLDSLDVLSRTPERFVVVSTDLSHFDDDDTARARDRRTADAVVCGDPAGIASNDACGAYALRGLVEWGRRNRLSTRLLDMRTSAEASGDRQRVVGYAAFAMTRG
jgi:AmmeMemoRadiSam system protein B